MAFLAGLTRDVKELRLANRDRQGHPSDTGMAASGCAASFVAISGDVRFECLKPVGIRFLRTAGGDMLNPTG